MVQARETLAFDSLHRAFREPLLRFFSRRLPDGAAAEDMVQQVFERLVQRGEIDSIENVRGFVYRVAENVFADHMRRAAVRRSHAHDQFDESLHAGVDFSPEHVLAKRQRLARVMDILQALPERTRIIFVLRRIEGWKYQEIAAHYGISVSAVEKHVERAVERLVAQMGDET
jgi:RNA polymerase sigma-70 factor (ECF subfamily)